MLRAKQAWQKELKTEKAVQKEYQLLLEKVNQVVAELYASYGEEGHINYNKLRMKLTPTELALYKNSIQEIISLNKDITDEDLLIELEKLKMYQNLTVIASKLNTVEAHTLTTVHKVTELVSESLLETHDYIESYTNYDIQRKAGVGKPVKRNLAIATALILASDEFTGLTYPEAIKESRHRLLRDLKRDVVSGAKRHESFKKLSNMLKKEVLGGKGGKATTNILRGETTRVISETALEVYKSSGLERYQFEATLDDRTTQVCQDLDGTVHYIKDAVEGVNLPKMHYGCRSTVVPYIEDDDLSESLRKARDPNSGKNYAISGNISYKEWDKKYNN